MAGRRLGQALGISRRRLPPITPVSGAFGSILSRGAAAARPSRTSLLQARRVSAGRSVFGLNFLSGGERVPLTFAGHPFGTDGTVTVQARIGHTVLEVAREHDIELEGACEGQLACSTCHVILSPQHFSSLDPADEEELDMLDQAPGLQATSRLGCQLLVKKSWADRTITVPSEYRNMM